MVRCTTTRCWIIVLALVAGGCRASGIDEKPSLPAMADAECPSVGLQRQAIERVDFGRAYLAVGMSKEEVLEQIRLSRAQYEPLKDEGSTDLFIGEVTKDAAGSDVWLLTCPTRNAHVLGGGSGIILELRFHDGRVISIAELPRLAG